MNILKVFLLLFFTLSFSLCFSQGQPAVPNQIGMPFIRNFLPKDYHAGVANWAVVQDKRGVMYFGNDNGILEYNGIDWRLIKTANNSSVFSLSIDEDGRIYVGGLRTFGMLRPDSTGLLQYQSLTHLIDFQKVPFEQVWSIKTNKEGVIFQTDESLFIYKDDKITIVPPTTYFTFVYEVHGKCYVQQNNYGLMELVNGKLILVKGTERFNNTLIAQVLPFGDGKLLLCIEGDGLFIWDNGNIMPFKTDADPFLKEFRIYNAIVLDKNKIALATLGLGLVVLDMQGRILHLFNKRNGLADDFVISLCPDGQGGIWLGSYHGISRLEYPSPLTRFNERYHKISGVVNSIIKHQGEIYIATMNGLYVLKSRNLTKNFSEAEFRKNKDILVDCWDLLSFGDELIVATFSGLKSVKGEKITSIGSVNPQTFCLIRSKKDPNRIFVGSAYSVRSLVKVGNEWVDSGKLEGIREEVRFIEEDDEGNLWLSTPSKGVIKVRFGDFFSLNPYIERYGTDQGLPSFSGNHLFLINGEIKIGTEQGIYRYDKKLNKFYQDHAFDNPFNKGQHSVRYPTIDSKGNMWCFSNINDEEISLMARQPDGTYKYQSKILPRLNDLQDVQYIFAEDSNIIWLSDVEGIYRYEANEKTKIDFEFNSIIKQVAIGEDSVIFKGTYPDANMVNSLLQPEYMMPTLPYRYNSIRFASASVSYNEDINLFQSYLEGFDKSWSRWEEDDQKEYTNLPEGTYTYRIRSKDVYGKISREASYKFTILPPWYRTHFAYLCYAFILVGSFWGFVRWRISAIEKEKEVLAKKVTERTQELATTNDKLVTVNTQLVEQNNIIKQKSDEIADAYQKMFDLNTQLTNTVSELQVARKQVEKQRDELSKQKENTDSSIRYARRIQDAMLPYANKLNTWFSEHFIFYRPRDIVSGDFYWFTERNGKIIITAVDCTGHGVPGAFMSMIGFSKLSQVVNENNITESDEILNYLHEGIRYSLKQEETDNRDGMDMALCVIDKEAKTMSFTGAKNPIIICQKGNVELIKADKMPIGGLQREEKRIFSKHTFDISEPTSVYLFTDGYQDQFGGEHGKKFMTTNFFNLIQEISSKPMSEQYQIIQNTMNNWIKGYEQTDDILVIGLKI
jgi:serine phosphatase RsbU (regulator of sigma subunit)/ligand-binding sensor domain-containing protein